MTHPLLCSVESCCTAVGRIFIPKRNFWLESVSRLRLKCDGTRSETRFRLSAKRTSPFKSGWRQFSRLLAAEVWASPVVMLDTPCSEVVWRVLATPSIRQFPLHFPSRASLCAITFQLDSTILLLERGESDRGRKRTKWLPVAHLC
jgi:hypothetical protein